MTTYWLYRAAAAISAALPSKLAYWLGLRMADLFYWRNHAGRAAVVSNLRQVFTAQGILPAEDALDGFARKTFQYFGKYLVDFFRYSRLDPADIKRRVSFQHYEYLDQALAPGRGVIVVTAHFGNWEMGGAVMAALGYKFNAVVLPQRAEKLNRLFQGQRVNRGMHVIPLGSSALSVLRCLRRGEIVALLADRDFTGRNDRAMFFGKPARMPRGPVWLSKRTGAPILPGFLSRQVDDTFLMKLYPPILPETEPSEDSIQEKICRILEKEIGEQPFQWFIFNDFWEDGPAAAGAGSETRHDRGNGKTA